MKSIVIVDYGVGNLKSVAKAFAFLGVPAIVSHQVSDIEQADILVFPGVGAFEEGMHHLKSRELIPYILNHIRSHKPFIGICLGFQLLFEYSEENGRHDGLGVFKGSVKPFSALPLAAHFKIPHMGWNRFNPIGCYPQLLTDIPSNPYCYFVHSYYVDTPQSEIVFSTTEYGLSFTSAIATPTILATQFHPEKSGQVGLALLTNFLKVHAAI